MYNMIEKEVEKLVTLPKECCCKGDTMTYWVYSHTEYVVYREYGGRAVRVFKTKREAEKYMKRKMRAAS